MARIDAFLGYAVPAIAQLEASNLTSHDERLTDGMQLCIIALRPASACRVAPVLGSSSLPVAALFRRCLLRSPTRMGEHNRLKTLRPGRESRSSALRS